MIRMEVEMEKKSDEYKDLQSRISYMLQQVNDERKDLEKEKENMQVRRTHLFLIQHPAFLYVVDIFFNFVLFDPVSNMDDVTAVNNLYWVQ